MAAKMADFMQKYVHLNNAGYNEAIFQIIMTKVLFYINAQTRVATLNERTILDKHTFNMAANMAG